MGQLDNKECLENILNRSFCPFPPLAEQKRIADKLTMLFEELDTIKQNLTTIS
ncbi:hypothetical protein ME800_13470 [Lactobacillus delbrueckii]|nr:hypothetical protein ME798_16510 [Lactobacillus delbrueckii]GHN49738.1 hypothetical protein ME800_13470 [Lactobacillus delbrueckii]GHN57551.1 hypothetical protein ME804_15910 [Lactobacillus delbrueckii]